MTFINYNKLLLNKIKGRKMKKLTALIAIIAMNFIVGCGGGGSSDPVVDPIVDPMTERDLIVIFYHTPTGMCEDPTFQQFLKDGLASQGYVINYYLFREETNNVSCATYGRANDITAAGGCTTYDLVLDDPSFSIYDTSCVIGVDLDPYAQPTTKTLKTVGKDTNIVSDMTSAIRAW